MTYHKYNRPKIHPKYQKFIKIIYKLMILYYNSLKSKLFKKEKFKFNHYIKILYKEDNIYDRILEFVKNENAKIVSSISKMIEKNNVTIKETLEKNKLDFIKEFQNSLTGTNLNSLGKFTNCENKETLLDLQSKNDSNGKSIELPFRKTPNDSLELNNSMEILIDQIKSFKTIIEQKENKQEMITKKIEDFKQNLKQELLEEMKLSEGQRIKKDLNIEMKENGKYGVPIYIIDNDNLKEEIIEKFQPIKIEMIKDSNNLKIKDSFICCKSSCYTSNVYDLKSNPRNTVISFISLNESNIDELKKEYENFLKKKRNEKRVNIFCFENLTPNDEILNLFMNKLEKDFSISCEIVYQPTNFRMIYLNRVEARIDSKENENRFKLIKETGIPSKYYNLSQNNNIPDVVLFNQIWKSEDSKFETFICDKENNHVWKDLKEWFCEK